MRHPHVEQDEVGRSCSKRAAATSVPFWVSPTISKPPSASSARRIPSSMSRWSSAMTTRIQAVFHNSHSVAPALVVGAMRMRRPLVLRRPRATRAHRPYENDVGWGDVGCASWVAIVLNQHNDSDGSQPRHRGADRAARAGRGGGDRRGGRARDELRSPPGGRLLPLDRGRLLRRLATLVEENHEALSRLESANAGKPISGARGEIGMVAQVFHFYAGAVDKHYGETIPVAGGVDLTFREPLGVVGLITPWNFPLNIASWKIGPALATGNTIVIKPAELTPLTTMRLGELALEAGIPEGVLNVVVGKGSVVGQRLVEHPDVAKIGFTGSTEVGQRVMQGAAATIKRVTLELGGKSANVIFADADLERAAASAPYSVFDNAGQDCCARSRILVERTRLRPVSRVARRGDSWRQGRRPGRRGDRDGPVDLGRASCDSRFVRRGRAAVPRRGSRRARLLVPLHARRGVERRPRRARGGLRTGRRRDPVHGRSRRDQDRERHAVRPLGVDLDARQRPRVCASRAASTPACSRSTRTARCASTLPSAA